PVHLDHDDPASALGRDALVRADGLGVGPVGLADDLVPALPKEEAEVVPRVIRDERIRLELVAPATSSFATWLGADGRAHGFWRVQRGQRQRAESQLLEDPIFADALGTHRRTLTGNHVHDSGTRRTTPPLSGLLSPLRYVDDVDASG